MANDKITIGKFKEEKPDNSKLLKKDDFYKPEKPLEEAIPLDDNIWGNDSDINRQLDKKYLAEKRMFVRIRFFQQIECNTIQKNIDSKLEILNKPMKFSIFDISMGGIGIIYDNELEIGSVLCFNMLLDQVLYDIMCEVIYCIRTDDTYRIGLRIIRNNKEFIKHLKIIIARVTFT